jgi:glucose/arabinose dehydrogenase
VRRLALLGLLGLALAGCGSGGGSTSTATGAAPSTSTAAVLSHQVTIPQGWTASVFARLDQPRWLLWTPQKTLLVSQPSAGTITEISTDGKQQHVIASGLTQPQGMAFDGNTLYVAESDAIVKYRGTADSSGRRRRSSTACPTPIPTATTCTAGSR